MMLTRWPESGAKVKNIKSRFQLQENLVIRGRYVPLFWTANTEFAEKKTHFDYKFGLLDYFNICE